MERPKNSRLLRCHSLHPLQPYEGQKNLQTSDITNIISRQ